MFSRITISLILALLLGSQGAGAKPFDVERQIKKCHKKVLLALKSLQESGKDTACRSMPRNILGRQKHWNCTPVTEQEWCVGFFPGILWLDYEATKSDFVKRQARLYSSALLPLVRRKVYDHDLGFIMYCSLGNGYRLTGDDTYKQALLSSADTLATLFFPKAGTLLSWPRNVAALGGHNTIMDNMMNLELLFFAAQNGGSQRLRNIAISHAKTTGEHQFRKDFSCYHVAVYDRETGEFLRGVNHQGFSDESVWARGQSWAVYGYTMCYRFTREMRFLEQAKRVADAYLKRLGDEKVPYWDFLDPNIPNAPRDASTACVVASALLELQQYVDEQKAESYTKEAVNMLRQLSKHPYWSHQNDAFLLHSVGNMPQKSEVDASIVYADYYYLEALLRYRALMQGKPLFSDEHCPMNIR